MAISPVDNVATAAGSVPQASNLQPIAELMDRPEPKPAAGGSTPLGDGGQLNTGNPGGVGAGLGLGISLDTFH